eukprot:CAMPEP_0119532972 /NCGR_PEP_ID=MMETSP1344-20130328/46415_1 /TAXON_ID=236787 /ORGANISM="Florenciella parvula, Strain CCMP2471" /LENGTH=101 /DNA_ID=CAMNT_0007573665 /DNA_START=93 /DNA_END=394 /DNA_ORIENTATION=-
MTTRVAGLTTGAWKAAAEPTRARARTILENMIGLREVGWRGGGIRFVFYVLAVVKAVSTDGGALQPLARRGDGESRLGRHRRARPRRRPSPRTAVCHTHEP